MPFFGPPAWTVMAYFQLRYGLDVWWVLVAGVIGSTLGRYWFSLYIPLLSAKLIKPQKNEDIRFIGQKLSGNGWRIQLFVLLYTLVPLPTTSLFTAAGMARIRAINIIPAFFIGKFTSDALMLHAGKYAFENTEQVLEGMASWQTISGTLIGILLLLAFLFTDWKILLQQKKYRLNFRIWK
jgi:uncharacterized membrane protein YdjX (TVP38/TMEM64 family)